MYLFLLINPVLQITFSSFNDIAYSLYSPYLNPSSICSTYPGLQTQKIDYKLQKRAIRIITQSKYNAHTGPLFKQINLFKLSDRLTLRVLKLYYKYRNGNLLLYMLKMFSSNTKILTIISDKSKRPFWKRKTPKPYLRSIVFATVFPK